MIIFQNKKCNQKWRKVSKIIKYSIIMKKITIGFIKKYDKVLNYQKN
jgi:hypothetical protein